MIVTTANIIGPADLGLPSQYIPYAQKIGLCDYIRRAMSSYSIGPCEVVDINSS